MTTEEKMRRVEQIMDAIHNCVLLPLCTNKDGYEFDLDVRIRLKNGKHSIQVGIPGLLLVRRHSDTIDEKDQ